MSEDDDTVGPNDDMKFLHAKKQ